MSAEPRDPPAVSGATNKATRPGSVSWGWGSWVMLQRRGPRRRRRAMAGDGCGTQQVSFLTHFWGYCCCMHLGNQRMKGKQASSQMAETHVERPPQPDPSPCPFGCIQPWSLHQLPQPHLQLQLLCSGTHLWGGAAAFFSSEPGHNGKGSSWGTGHHQKAEAQSNIAPNSPP